MKLNRWYLTQNERKGPNTICDCIVVAKDEDSARNIHPSPDGWESNTWCLTPDKVTVILIGKAKPGMKEGLVIAWSFFREFSV